MGGNDLETARSPALGIPGAGKAARGAAGRFMNASLHA